MKKTLSILILLCTMATAFAQKERNIWYFGRNAGIDLNSGSPVTLTNGALNTAEGAATICDQNGALLFYSDGQKVWNRNHIQMTNGSGLTGHPSATCSAIIVPNPGNKNRYYVFTVGSHDPYSGNPAPPIPLSWSEVDMTLNGGLGDVVAATKNTLLFTGSTEKIAAVRHANGLYFWVIAQVLADGSYRSYLVDCNGVNAPVTSNLGHGTIASGLGYMKVSPNGRRFANAIWAMGYFLYDFDQSTGLISNRIDLGLPANLAYGTSFSPDNNLLYGVSLSDGIIHQWNLLAGSPAAISASRTAVGNAGTGAPYKGGAIQDAPDGKLYFIQYRQAYLGAIHSPNTVGTGCNAQLNVVNLQGRIGELGLPTFIQHRTDTLGIDHKGHCLNAPTLFSRTGTSFLDSVRWDFDDPASGSANTSRDTSPVHQFTTADSFRIRLVRYLACISDTTYATVKIQAAPAVDLGPDTTTCGDTLILRPANSHTGASLLWNTGSSASFLPVTATGTYWLEVTENGCRSSDTIIVDISAKMNVDLGPDRRLCDRDTPVILEAPQPPGTHYLWSNGLSDTRMTVTRSGTFWLSTSRNGCTGSDTIRIDIVPTPNVYIGADSTICAQWPHQIGMDVPGASYLWNTGETTAHIHVARSGDYRLEVDLNGCLVADTVRITAMPAPAVDLGPDRDICPGQSLTLDGTGEPGNRYLWNTGATSATISAQLAGIYYVTVVSAYGCTGSDSVLLSDYPLPTVLLGRDTTVCEETPLELTAFRINTDSLRWSDGSSAATLSVRTGGIYTVTAFNKCGADTDTIGIRQIFCDIAMPNAFSPNGDGINDVFRALGNLGRAAGFRLSIFSRWGELLFETNDKYRGWDGIYRGQPAMLGTYVYLLSYQVDGKAFLEKGNFHLVR